MAEHSNDISFATPDPMSLSIRALTPALFLASVLMSARADSSPPPSSSSPSAPATVAPAPNAWAVTTAQARYVVEIDGTEKGAALSSVEICLPNPAWANGPVRVFTDSGTAVGSDLLWTAPGEPSTFLFDSSSGSTRYKFYFDSNWPPLHLQDAKAGVWLETREGSGQAVNNLPEMLQAWDKSTTVYGRSILNAIFEGGHRHGVQGNVLSHFQGWFEMAQPGELDLAAMSTDASFILVDGKEVVEWPGHHPVNDGMQGKFQGKINLPAGVHLMDYYNAYGAMHDGWPMLCCVAAEGGALQSWTMLMPQTAFFKPTSHAHVIDYEQAAGATAAPPFAFDWQPTAQSLLSPDSDDPGLITMRLSAHPQPKATFTWTFDDGATAQGASVEHLFARAGSRLVRLDVQDGGKSLGGVSTTILVHPNWTRLTTYPPQFDPVQRAVVLGLDFSKLPAGDLASLVAVSEIFKDTEVLAKLVPAAASAVKDMKMDDLPYIKDAAFYLLNQTIGHDAEAAQLLNPLIARAGTDKSPSVLVVANASRVALAQLTLRTSNRLDEVAALLAAIDLTTLNGDEHRGCDILRADLALAQGDVTGARKQYLALTGDPTGPDARSSIRRTAKIGQARAFMDRKDDDAATDTLKEVAWQAPIEKLSPDWALARLRLYRDRGQAVEAYWWARRLLPVVTSSDRSTLLYQVIDLAMAQGDHDLARQTLRELEDKHPYSEEAAKAHEKWPVIP